MTTSSREDQDALRQGAQKWAELDPGRFGRYSERLTARLAELDLEASHRGEAGQEQRTAEEQESKTRGQGDLEKVKEHRQASSAADARGDEANNEADRHGQVADEIDADGPAYDSAARREETAKEMTQAGVPEPPREAKLTADHLNAEHPKTAARSGQGGQRRPPRVAVSSRPAGGRRRWAEAGRRV